jgi:hypothetical protein
MGEDKKDQHVVERLVNLHKRFSSL